MARSSITIKDADDVDRDVACYENADSTFSQVIAESYKTFRVTKVTVTSTSTTITDLLIAGTPTRTGVLPDRKKLVVYCDPDNSDVIRYSDGTASADCPPLPAQANKELWIDAEEDAQLYAATSQTAYIEEYA